MKTKVQQADLPSERRANGGVAIQQAVVQRRGSAGVTGPGLGDHRPLAIAQRKLLQSMDGGPRQLAQAERLSGVFGQAVRRQGPEKEERLQGRFDSGAEPVQLEADARASENRTGMPDQLKSGVERLSGTDLSDVRVHRSSAKPAQLNAHAFAQGNDIHLGPGQERHLPHEAWHVVQQRQGRVRPTVQLEGVQVNDEVGLEREADLMGERALV